jgi:DNA adenine methylase
MKDSPLLKSDAEGDSQLCPPLKWAGGKRWLVKDLQLLFEPYQSRRLVEPFVGAVAVALGLSPRSALLCDINPHAINFYNWLQRGLKTRTAMENSAQCYYRNRERFNVLIQTGQADSKESAELFYYLNRTGYNGLCRFNSKGLFNVPFGQYKKISYRRDFTDYQRVLSKWQFRCCDFEAIRLRKTDFVYADPPYDVEFTRYSKNDFTWDDQLRLAKWLKKHQGPVVASNQATPRILKLYKSLGFAITLLSAPRRISCTGDRSRVQEMLATRDM